MVHARCTVHEPEPPGSQPQRRDPPRVEGASGPRGTVAVGSRSRGARPRGRTPVAPRALRADRSATSPGAERALGRRGTPQPRPTNGIFVAVTVMNSTFASSGRL